MDRRIQSHRLYYQIWFSKSMKNKISLSTIVLSLLTIFLIVFSMSAFINLPTADLGRHIKNGELIVQAITKKISLTTETPLFSNFYSYTYPSFKVNNHHWLTGVIHYFVNELGGFKALSMFNISCVTIANIIFFICARLFSNTALSLSLVALNLPLICWRNEVRPEQISYILLGFLLLILILTAQKKIKTSFSALLVFLTMMLWVNLHIFFGLGLFMIGCFYLGKILDSSESKKLVNSFLILGLAGLAGSLINPFGFSGLMQPVTIFQNFGYELAENQSVFFMHKRFPYSIIYYYYDLIAILGLICLALFINKNFKKLKSLEISLILISIVFMIIGFKTTRLIPNYSFISIPMLGLILGQTKLAKSTQQVKLKIFSIIFLVFLFVFYYNFYKKQIILGVDNGTENSAMFFLANNIQGPIFNNYDIGGYLIYYLFPRHKVFVDNRPEAYPREFFEDVYKPMQAKEDKWLEIDQKYNFNVIYFMRHDMTEDAQPFLIRRVQDPNWAVVFVDNFNIIFLKRNEINRDLITKYEIPKKFFKAVPQ